MKISILGIPPSLNRSAGRKNVWSYREEKKIWTNAVRVCALQELSKVGRPKAPEYALVRINYYFPDRRRRDADNYCGKFLLDGLTKAGAIKDDDFTHIALQVHGYVDRQQPRTEIEVTEAEHG